MSFNIKGVIKSIKENIVDELGSSKILMEDIYISTVIRNELFLANKDWIKGYQPVREPEEKGGILKKIAGLKMFVTSSNVTSQREQYLSFMKNYRKFLQKSINTVSTNYPIEQMNTEDFKELLASFPEIVICLSQKLLREKGWEEIIIAKLKEEFQQYSKEMTSDVNGRSLRVSKLTPLGAIKVYSSPRKDYFLVRNFLVLQNALLANIDILSNESKNNPFLYINAFNRQEEVNRLNQEYAVGLRNNINQKIFHILSQENNSVFFGFANFSIVNPYIKFIEKQYEEILIHPNIFRNFVEHIGKETKNDDDLLSLFHEAVQYMDLENEECRWTNISQESLLNILFLLKHIRILSDEQTTLLLGEDADSLDLKESNLYAKLVRLLSEEKNNMSKRKIDNIVIGFVVENFKHLNSNNKEVEYKWLLDNISVHDPFQIVLTSLARDNALQNKNDKNNEIELLVQLYLNNFIRYQHRLDINYIIWLNRNDQKIIDFEQQFEENDAILTLIPSIKLINNKTAFSSHNLQKIDKFLGKINSEEEQEKLFILMEKTNKVLLGTTYIRSLIDGYKKCNKEFKNELDEIGERLLSNPDGINHATVRSMLLNKEIQSIISKEEDFSTNSVLGDSYLLQAKEKFKGIRSKKSSLDFENDYQYTLKDCQFKLNHLLYAMTYEYIGEAAFEFEHEFMEFINQKKSEASFSNIPSHEILYFMKSWVYGASREGYLRSKIDEQEQTQREKQMEEEFMEIEWKAKAVSRGKKKI